MTTAARATIGNCIASRACLHFRNRPRIGRRSASKRGRCSPGRLTRGGRCECTAPNPPFVRGGHCSRPSHAVDVRVRRVPALRGGPGGSPAVKQPHPDHEQRQQIDHRAGHPHDDPGGRLVLQGPTTRRFAGPARSADTGPGPRTSARPTARCSGTSARIR